MAAYETPTCRDRVLAALAHREPDRVPRFEIWIDGLVKQLGQADPVSAYVNLGQDGILMPSCNLPRSNAWGTGIDEWGRIWDAGMYVDGALHSPSDIRQYTPDPCLAQQRFPAARVRDAREVYPEHCLFFGTHNGPFTAAYMAMGPERFFMALVDDPAFARAVLEARTEWCIAVYQVAIALGAEVVVLGDDAGSVAGPMVSPDMWRRFVLPLHKEIVEALTVPVLWHTDGNVESLLPMAIEAGFVGLHGLDPTARMDLGHVKREYGQDLVLVGNVDVRVLFGEDLTAVRAEVDRCLQQAAAGGGYMLATCNSIYEGMNPAAVAELFRYEALAGPHGAQEGAVWHA
jgi:uroporphyrinogen decarboxylase